MTMVPLDFYGVHTIGPENFVCILLHSQERDRIILVWISPIEGARLAARSTQWEPDRPDTYDVATSVINQSTSGASAVEITSYVNGNFIATLQMNDGEEIDTRVSDAVMMALLLDLPILADEDVVAQAGMWLSHDDAQEYFGVELPELGEPEIEADASASGDATADAEFAAMMRSMGVDASDLTGAQDGARDEDHLNPHDGRGTDGANDKDVTKDDNDEV